MTKIENMREDSGLGRLLSECFAGGELLRRVLRLSRAQAERQAAEKAAQEAILPGRSVAVARAEAAKPVPKHATNGIVVEGLDNCLVKFAKCCTPVPGDPIVGFITRGFGVSVHRSDCPNCAPEKRKPEEAGRWVKVAWATDDQNVYQTSLTMSGKDRDGLTLDVAMALSAAKVKVKGLTARSMPDGYANVSIVLEVKDQAEPNAVINKLGQIQGVYQVKRAAG